MALPSAEILNETMWVVYYFVAKKSPNFIVKGTNIDENFMVNLFESKKKISGFLKDFGLSDKLKGLSYEISNIDSKMNVDDAKKFFVKNKWHEALKSQVLNLINNPKISFINNLKVVRQTDFYEKSEIDKFLKKVWNVFSFTGTYDRWNPSDVWFYDESAIKEIKDYIKLSSVNRSETSLLQIRVRKNLALNDIIGLNKLMMKLYNEKKLAPISLKKATLSRGSYSARIGLVNIPQTKEGKPTPPKVLNKRNPIKSYGSIFVSGSVAGSGVKDLQYDIEIDVATMDMNGNVNFKRERDSIVYNPKGGLVVKKESQFKEAQGGSLGITDANKILYTANGSREIKKIRRDVFKQPLSSDLVSGGKMIGKNYEDKLKNSFEYIDKISNEIDGSTKNKKMTFAVSSAVNEKYLKDQKVYVEAQNKLEIALAIEKSGVGDEIILDLWSAITSKGITNRRDYERLVERIGWGLHNKSKKKGQKRLTQEQADELAKHSLSATIMGSQSKVPSSFHIKLY
jgi:hypothetical protein